MKLRFALTCAASLAVTLLLSAPAWAQAITRGAPLGDSPVVNGVGCAARCRCLRRRHRDTRRIGRDGLSRKGVLDGARAS